MGYENPVLTKELKSKLRLRQPKPVVMSLAALGLLLLVWIYYEAITYLLNSSGEWAAKDAWVVGLCLQAILIWVVAPALASNAITQEREQQTWEMLLFTRLTPLEILSGKLVARLIPMAILLALGLPYMLLCYARSSLTPGVFFVTYFTFGFWTIVLVSMSLFMSWAFRRTASAVAMAYLVLFALAIGTALVSSIFAQLTQQTEDTVLVWLNPVRITAALMDPTAGDNTAVLVFSTLTFAAITAFLFWRMAARFRAFAVE